MKTAGKILCAGALVSLVVSAPLLVAASKNQPSVADLTPAEFILTVEDQLISLRAREASIQAIVEDIGQKVAIEVLGTIPQDEMITTAFERFPVAEALQRLSPNYGYQLRSNKGGQEVATIFVLPKPDGFVRPQPAEQAPPMVQSTTPSPQEEKAQGARALPRQPDDDDSTDGKPAPFKFQFDPSALMPK